MSLGQPRAGAASAADAGQVSIRLLGSTAEFASCVEAQRRIWGAGFGDVVPATLLQVSPKIGGVVAGAFLRDDSRVIGFVYGLTGIREGRLTHWSHMLGVVPEHRGRGIGQRLKRFQRDCVLVSGVREILWSFDPLIAGNAHFNLNLLGVDIESYAPDMYAETGSSLHSFGTDRFVALWDLGRDGGDARPKPPRPLPPDLADIPLANPVPGMLGGTLPDPRDPGVRRVQVEIPEDILEINRSDPASALAWRQSTRAAFTRCFQAGFRVAGFARIAPERRCVYILERT